MERKVDESFAITMRKTLVCPKAEEVVAMATTLPVTVPSVISDDIISNKKYGMCLNEVGDGATNVYALIDKITRADGTELDADDIKYLKESTSYEVVIDSFDGKIFSGTFNTFVSEGAATSQCRSELQDDIDELVENIIASGIASQEEMDARMKVLTENEVDDLLILRVLKGYRKYNKPCHKPSCIFQDPYFEDSKAQKREGIIAEGLRSAVSRNAIICEGEKSVGKNVYVETIAWLLNMPLYLITFTRQMSPSSIYGEKTTDNTAAQALASFDSDILAKADAVEDKKKFMLNFYFKQGMSADEAMKMAEENLTAEEKHYVSEAARFKMLQAQSSSVNIVIDQSELYDWLIDGGLMCFNELNMSDANFFASFTNQLLDGTGFIFIQGRGDVAIHKDCVLFGTMNADYQGTDQLNEATASRFGGFKFEQPESIKKQLVVATETAIKKGDFPSAKLSSKHYTQCQNFYQQCNKAVKRGDISNACLNIRGFVRALTAVAESNGHANLKRQIEIHVINTCPSDDRPALVATLEQIVTL